MHPYALRWAGLLALAACTAETATLPPTPHATSVAIVVTTTGSGVRPASYMARIDADRAVILPASGRLTITDLAPGTHRVAIEAVPDQCIPDWVEPQSVTTGASVEFRVHCVVPIRGELVFARGVLPDNYREMWTMRPDGGGQRSLGVIDGLLSPHGTMIAHHLFDGETRVVSVDGVIDVLIGPRYTGPLAWSPDGRYVALSSTPRTLTIARADGRGSRTLSGVGSGVYSAAAWSPDGRELALIDDGALRVLTLASGTLRTLPRASATVGAAWSPDGSRLATLTEGITGSFRLITLRPDGGDEQTVLADLPGAAAVEWAPDGGGFLFSAKGAPGVGPASLLLDLFSVALDGSGVRNVTRTPTVNEFRGAWTP